MKKTTRNPADLISKINRIASADIHVTAAEIRDILLVMSKVHVDNEETVS